MIKYKQFKAGSSAAQVDTTVINEQDAAQIFIKRLNVYAAHANDIVKVYVPKAVNQTSVITAVAAVGVTNVVQRKKIEKRVYGS